MVQFLLGASCYMQIDAYVPSPAELGAVSHG